MQSEHEQTVARPQERPVLTLGELLALLAALGVVLGTWSSLLLADMSLHSGFGVVALALGGAALCVVLAMAFARPSIRVDWRELVGLAALALVAAIMFVPGFRYAAGGIDPGVYVNQAFAITEQGSTSVADPGRAIAADLPEELQAGAGHQGFYADPDDPDRWVSRFYNLFPASLATADSLAGDRGLFNLNPFLAVLSVLTLTLAARRAIAWQTGAIAGGLLAINMMQVWQAKYQTAEILTQLLIAGAILAIVVAIRTRWMPAALLGGVLTGLTFLARPDAVVFVLLGLGGAGTLFALRRYTRESLWYAGGLAVTLPHAFIQAFGVQGFYSHAVGIPSALVTGALIGLMVVGAAAGRWLIVPWAAALWSQRGPDWDAQRVVTTIGWVIVATFGLVLVFGALRPWIQGDLDGMRSNGEIVRVWNERNVLRLSWFITAPGLVLAWLGLAVVALRERTAAAWALVLPGVISIPIYLNNAHIAPRLMWWVRRFVPVIVPTLIILIAVALSFALLYRGRWRIGVRAAGAVLTVGIAFTYLSQSLPLRTHHEFAGTYEAAAGLADLAGEDQAAFLWVPGGYLSSERILKAPLVFINSQISLTLPDEPQQSDVDTIAKRLSGTEVFVVSRIDELPAGLDPDRYELVDQEYITTPIWEEPSDHRPTKAKDFPVRTNIWVLR